MPRIRPYIVPWCFFAILFISCDRDQDQAQESSRSTLRIPVQEYQDKVYASWLGQIIGNIYGLSYEFKYIAEPGPDEFPYGFGVSLARVEDANGAFSDDDTDIEYMYLLQMERHGIEPTYAQLAEAWKYHVRDKVWVANRMALTLMRAGYSPPITGNKDYNPQWFQIDPQLVNEIWAVTAPGMVDYATQKSAWAAKITNDDFGIEPTIHYAAMYAAAFVETDIHRLIDIGTHALPDGSRFARTVEHMKELHRQYPDDWHAARAQMAGTYFAASAETGYRGTFDYNEHAWAPVDANLNGACAILALLYGNGDFQRTLDIASGLGFDADNQAATMSGLLGIVHGPEGIPRDLLYPLGQDKWTQPFNDFYKNVSRHELPDAALSDIARRMAAQGEKVILANGGRIVVENGVDYYEIDSLAQFTAPFEPASAPTLLAEKGKAFSFQYFFGENPDEITYEITAGSVPPGVQLENNRLTGIPSATGKYNFEIQLRSQTEARMHDYSIRVYGENLAMGAKKILVNESMAEEDIEVIRDGDRRGVTYYNRGDDGEPRVNYYGYEWNQRQTISTLIFNPGFPEEFGGWFTSLEVQYRNADDEWQTVEGLSIEPELDFDNTQWLKGSHIDHVLSFAPVTTNGVRIIGNAGGITPDAHTGEARRYFTAISELSVYGD